jgi:hypothetical protein
MLISRDDTGCLEAVMETVEPGRSTPPNAHTTFVFRIEFAMRGRSKPENEGKYESAEPVGLPALLWGLKSDSTSTNPEVDAAIDRLRAWAGSDPSHRAALALRLGIVLPLEYGTEYGHSHIATLKAELEQHGSHP